MYHNNIVKILEKKNIEQVEFVDNLPPSYI